MQNGRLTRLQKRSEGPRFLSVFEGITGTSLNATTRKVVAIATLVLVIGLAAGFIAAPEFML